MKQEMPQGVEQPEPFTKSVTKAMVRQHAFMLHRDKLREHGLTLEDWVLAEKDLVRGIDSNELAPGQMEGR